MCQRRHIKRDHKCMQCWGCPLLINRSSFRWWKIIDYSMSSQSSWVPCCSLARSITFCLQLTRLRFNSILTRAVRILIDTIETQMRRKLSSADISHHFFRTFSRLRELFDLPSISTLMIHVALLYFFKGSSWDFVHFILISFGFIAANLVERKSKRACSQVETFECNSTAWNEHQMNNSC